MNRIQDIKCFLLDMDGTIYLGDKLIDGAKEFLDTLQEKKIKYFFLTNNSSKDKLAYIKKLKGLGIDAEENDVFSSGDATIHYLKKHTNYKKIFMLGTDALTRSFEKEGFEVISDKDVDVDCVVLGFDTTLTYNKLWAACDYVRKVPYIATHPDLNCPLEDNKVMPDVGAMIAFIKAATGKEPIIIGKPKSYMLDAIMDNCGFEKQELAMVGDRLYTDIKMGVDLGFTSILVLSGETNIDDYEKSPINADYIFPSVKEIIDTL
ncbi:HAD-IIA family hydrolase [Alkalibaculum sp. M08DMB]|uniref:Acid sugar phosphatase n=1 Tax=Alkalibaculum sporogenes TaxID=2655001 RepID=A0A6A7K711_9FIRM|nr:HAD-IIA family hydrolase [Alkalibaculum sporogenes]MPW25121.1 HAD-IIA family hydrolase [Alkalibaculum sporogenes]